VGKLFNSFREKIASLEPKKEEARADIRRSYSPEPLSRTDRADLLRLREDSSYQVLLKLMERECESIVTALIETEPSDSEKVLANQTAANVAWNFYKHLQAAIQYECEMEVADREGRPIGNDLDSPDVIAKILDPLYSR
jgi:hypothetical protein